MSPQKDTTIDIYIISRHSILLFQLLRNSQQYLCRPRKTPLRNFQAQRVSSPCEEHSIVPSIEQLSSRRSIRVPWKFQKQPRSLENVTRQRRRPGSRWLNAADRIFSRRFGPLIAETIRQSIPAATAGWFSIYPTLDGGRFQTLPRSFNPFFFRLFGRRSFYPPRYFSPPLTVTL